MKNSSEFRKAILVMTNLCRDQLELRQVFEINLLGRLNQNDQSTILLGLIFQAISSSMKGLRGS